MAPNKEKTKLCLVTTCAELPIRGGIHGPFHTPSLLTYREVITLVNNNIDVYEVNPRNKSQKVKLSTFNAVKENFPKVASTSVTTKSMIKDAKKEMNIEVKKPKEVLDIKPVSSQAAKPKVETKETKIDETEKVLKPDFI